MDEGRRPGNGEGGKDGVLVIEILVVADILETAARQLKVNYS